MSKKEIALWLVLADFVALTVYAVATQGYFAFVPLAWEFATSSAWGAQILVDFLLALAVALGFLVADARRQGLSWWPFVALTLTLGSIGPLAYLVFRERALAGAGERRREPAVQPA
ncbi:MAG: DUF2834 domain-containing protein [Myxococcota bacterium]